MKKSAAIITAIILLLTLALPTFAQNTGSLSISAYDANAALVPVPSGNCGERVKVRIPLICNDSAVSDVSISPVISTLENEFPFEVEKLDYTLSHKESVQPNQIIEFEYDFMLRNTVQSGLYDVKFNVSYTNSTGEIRNLPISVYVKVNEGYTQPTPAVSLNTDMPVLMLDSYSVNTEKLYAGEDFTLTLTVKNTSSTESIKNIQLRLTDGTGTVIPTSGNSASAYISGLSRGDSKKVSFSLQSSPDAAEGKYSLALSMSYQGSKSLASFTTNESMTVSLLQKQRIKIDEPTLYDEAVVGTVSGVSLAIYNMGKAPVYNCMVSVEGDGLSLVESYFGGNLAAGGTLRPDLELLTEKAGFISGKIVVSYEDAYGVQSAQTVPLEIRVEEENTAVVIPSTASPDSSNTNAPSSAWIWIVAAIALIAVLAVIFLAKKRRKDIEDI